MVKLGELVTAELVNYEAVQDTSELKLRAELKLQIHLERKLFIFNPFLVSCHSPFFLNIYFHLFFPECC